MPSKRLTKPAIILICLLSFSFCLCASADEKTAFYPTWKLLNGAEKAEFIAGYLQGWADARNVTGIALDFIKENPDKAINSLEDIKKLYDVSALKRDKLVAAIDEFYEKPQNKAFPLSVAVTAAKNSLSR